MLTVEKGGSWCFSSLSRRFGNEVLVLASVVRSSSFRCQRSYLQEGTTLRRRTLQVSSHAPFSRHFAPPPSSATLIVGYCLLSLSSARVSQKLPLVSYHLFGPIDDDQRLISSLAFRRPGVSIGLRFSSQRTNYIRVPHESAGTLVIFRGEGYKTMVGKAFCGLRSFCVLGFSSLCLVVCLPSPLGRLIGSITCALTSTRRIPRLRAQGHPGFLVPGFP